MDLRDITIIVVIFLFAFSTYPIISGEVSLLNVWTLFFATFFISATALLVWALKPDLEKSRIKIINFVVKPQTSLYGEDNKIASIIFKNVVYFGDNKIQNGKIEMMIKGLWDKFERLPWDSINIDSNQTYTLSIFQIFKNKDHTEIIMGEVDHGKDSPLINILKKDYVYELSVKFLKDNQEEKIYHLKLNTSWENFGLTFMKL
jgi:hypothetical protein